MEAVKRKIFIWFVWKQGSLPPTKGRDVPSVTKYR